MNNTCVMCGADLPTECNSMVCPKCQRGDYPKGPLCPTCGTILETMDISRYETTDGFGYSTIYHCNHCDNDWEKEEEFVTKPIIFKRKYWG